MQNWPLSVLDVWTKNAISLLSSRFSKSKAKRNGSGRFRSDGPPFRRKMLFEMLEPRILLSADPFASVSAGVLSTQLGDSANELIVTQVGAANNGGVILDLTLDGLTERYGSADEGVVEIVADGGGGDDRFQFINVTAAVHLQGGAGSDSLVGPVGDSQWLIDGPDSGRIANLGFFGIENLVGAAGNQDTFTFTEDGSVSGAIDGGAGGFDTLVLDGGSFGTVSFIAMSTDSGEVRRDADVIRYSGLEPIQDNTNSANRVIGLSNSADADATLSANSAQLTLSGSTFEGITFQNPTQSLTIDGLGGRDVITIDSNIDLGGTDLILVAENIFVSGIAHITTTGDVTLTAIAENNVVGSTSTAPIDISARILVDGEIDVGGALRLGATVNNTVDLDASGVSLAIESKSSAIAQIGSSANITAGNLTVSAVTNTNFSVNIINATSGSSGLGDEVVNAGRSNAYLLNPSDNAPAKFYLWDSTSLDTTKSTYVVTHGWRDGIQKLSSWVDLLNSLKNRLPDANVIFTDWSEESTNPIYPLAADATYEIGGLLAGFLEAEGLNPSTTTLIGHSLGGQVSGIAADRYESNTGNSIAQIIALDPAGPVFEEGAGFDGKDLAHRLDAGDADRVVALHTTSILGFDAPLAHLDLYINPDSPLQPGEANFIGNHGYAITLLTQLAEGELFSQAPLSLVGDDFEFADLLNATLTGEADVDTYDSPIEVTTVASIEGGAVIEVGATAISVDEPASVLVQAIDHSNLQSTIITGTLSDLTSYDFVQGEIGLNRDTSAYIGDATQSTTLTNAGGSATGVVRVLAQNDGNVNGVVSSDFLEYNSTTFARENVQAYVENASLNVAGLDVSAGSSSAYATVAEENINTVRGIVKSYINDSTVTAGAAGVTLSADEASSYSATSDGEGGRISLNDVRKDVSAYAADSTITVTDGDIDISANNLTTLNATSNLSATGTVIADSEIFAINVVNGDVDAYAESSTLTTVNTGNISVNAKNAATINAEVKGDATASSNSIIPIPSLSFGAGMAFNAVGWDMANVLLATVDDFLGDLSGDWLATILPVAESTPAQARAYLLDTKVVAGGDLTVESSSAPQINATISNAAESTASSLFLTVGGAAGAVLASNKINSAAEAWVDYSDTYTHLAGDDVSAGGSISILASDNAGVYANSKMVASSVTTNDGGASLLGDAVNNLAPTDFQSDDGMVDIAFGDRVRLADDFGAEDYSSDDGLTALVSGKLVRLADDYAAPVFTSESGVRLLRTGDVVQLADGYQDAFGTPGGLYRFVGTGSRGLRVDLSAENYTDGDRWQAIGGTDGSVYEYVGAAGTRDLTNQDYSDTTLWREIVGAAGDIYQYMGEDTNNLDLAAADFSDLGLWKLEPVTQLIPSGLNVTSSGSMAIGAIVVMNDVRSDVDAFIHDATVTADGGIDIQAIESAVIRAETDALSSSSGGSIFGKGTSLAVNATIATNIVLSEADAYIDASDVTTTTAADGKISVYAQNISQIDATTRSASISGQNSAAFLLALNTVGWEAQGILSNTLDALLGMTALGTEQPARVEAYLMDTHIDAAGGLTITADSSAQINALVTNDATSFPAAFFGAAGMSASGILSSNMVSSSAKAYIGYSDTYTHAPVEVETGGAITITALDDAAINADTRMYAEVSPTNDAGSGLLNNLAGTLIDDYQYTDASGTQDLQFGDKVLVTDDYFPADFEVDGSEVLETIALGDVVHLTDDYGGDGGEAGGLYKFIGTAPGGAINLGIEDYTDTARWVRVGGTYEYMGTSASGANTDLGAQDYTNFGFWKRLNPANLITDSTVYAALSVVGTVMKKEGLVGNSTSYYGLIDRNDVRSEVLSYIDDAKVMAAGDIVLTALESARINALEDSYVVPWTGRGGIIATNVVLSSANAYITDSDIETTAGGSVILDAQNLSSIDASTTSKVEAWDSATAVVAFNSIGWKAQNILFSALDTLMGDPLISSAFNGQQSAEVQAYILDSTVDAAGDVTLTALSTAQINAFVGNENISEAALDIVIPGAMEAATGVAGGGVLASNKVSSFAKAYIDFTAAAGSVDAGGALTVHAEDTAGITADSVVIQQALTSNTLTGVVDQINALLPGDIDYTSESGVVTLSVGDRVRLGPTYAGLGVDGAVYRYEGGLLDADDITDGHQVNLGNPQDYANTTHWKKLVGGTDNLEDLYPNIGNITDSDATAVGILVVMNDVRSAVDAYIDNAVVTAAAPAVVDHEITAPGAFTVDLETGQRVRTLGGDVFEFTAGSGETDLGGEDFADGERWRVVEAVNVRALETAFIQATAESNVEASGGSFYGSGSVLAVNGQVVTNVVLSGANAYIRNSEITTGAGDSVDVFASNDSAIDATILSATSSGETGVGVTLAFNTVGWESQNFLFNAFDTIIGRPLDDYDFESSDSVDSLQAGDRVKHAGTIYWFQGAADAGPNIALSAEDYSDTSRWKEVTSAFAGEQPAAVQAYILDSAITVGGDLTLTATSEAQINATVSNAAETNASALKGANGKSVGGVVASNKVSSFAKAYIDGDGIEEANVDGDLTITALDNAGIYANSKMVSSSITTNDGGASVIQETINDFIPADHLSSEGTVQVEFGDKVRLAGDYGAANFTTDDGVHAVGLGTRVEVADGYDEARFTTDSGRRLVLTGDTVQLADSYAGGGEAGRVYEYVGAGGTGLRLDLGVQDYSDAAKWKKIGGEAGVVYEKIGGSTAAADLGKQDYSDATQWKKIGGAGAIYEYLGTTADLDLNSQDYTDLGYWKEVLLTKIIPTGYNVSESNAMGIGGLIVLNDVRSDVDAYIVDAIVSADSLTLTADETAVIRANADSAVTASGGSAFGKGSVIAVNGTIATNLVLSSASAYIADSDVTAAGEIDVVATNVSLIDATTLSATTSGDTAVGVTLAFNSIGWTPQNVLFNALDTLLGRPGETYDYESTETADEGLAVGDRVRVADGLGGFDIYWFRGEPTEVAVDLSAENYNDAERWDRVEPVFSQEQPARVEAYVLDSTILVGGDLNVSALNEAEINATVGNEATSAAVALKDASALSVGFVAAKNMVSSTVSAYLQGVPALANAGDDHVAGDVSITSEDAATIIADSTLKALASAQNDYGLSVAVDLLDALLTDYQFTSNSGSQAVEEGAVVRVADDYSVAGARGKVYQYTGAATTLDLGAQAYSTSNDWEELVLDKLFDFLTNVSLDLTNSDANAFGGLVVRNDVRGGAESYINDATLAVHGDLTVTALETATIRAVDLSTVESSGGAKAGSSIAVNGLIASNLVLSKANAFITDSAIDTRVGDVVLDAQNTSTINAAITSDTRSKGVGIGVTLAYNTIGYEAQDIFSDTIDALFGAGIADEQPARVKAYIERSSVEAGAGVSLSAVSDATIDANIGNSVKSITVALKVDGIAVAGSGVIALNKISTDVKAYIDDAPSVHAQNDDIGIATEDTSAITALVDAPATSVVVSLKQGSAVSVALSVARNEIHNDMAAFVRDVDSLTATNGSVDISAVEDASIDATSTASAIAVAVSLKGSLAVGGGGAVAINSIQGSNSAFIEDSSLTATGSVAGDGEVRLDASSDSSIIALVKASAISVAVGGGQSAPAVAIGVSIARNMIGWSEYGGATPVEVKAYIADSNASDSVVTNIDASRGVSVSATSVNEIDATVRASAVAVAASTKGGFGGSVAGLWTDNKIASDVYAYIDGAGHVRVTNGIVSVTASDESTITADTQAVAVAASLTGSSGGAVSIGLSLAHNTIDNDIAAYVAHTPSVLTGGGDVVINAEDDATIEATSVAVAVSAGISAETGVALAGGGSESTNVILTTTNAYISSSTLGSSGEKVGKVDIDAGSTADIDATIAAVAASVSFGGTTGVGVALGIGVARNFIGWDPNATTVASNYDSDGETSILTTGQKVKIVSGPMTGEVFEYLGPTLTDGDSNTDGVQPIDMSTQSYQDKSAWRQSSLGASPAQIQAKILDSSIQASGALTLNAVANQSIDAIVVAGAAALSGGGTTGVGVSGAGVYTENKIKALVKAYIDGDGATAASDGITVASVSIDAHDSSVINAVAGAASLAGSVGGTTGVSVAIGLSLAFNEVSNDVSAYLANADEGVFAAGNIKISAASQGNHLFDINLGGSITAASLDDAAEADQDDPDQPGNQATSDLTADYATLTALRNAFATAGETLAIMDTVASGSMYTTDFDELTDLREGTTVKLAAGYSHGGTAGRVYRYVGADRDDVDLGNENYASTSNWLRVEPLKLSVLEEGKRWSLVAPDGATYVLEKIGSKLTVGRETINAVSAAAALAAGFGGTTGVAVSGAGAVAQNVVLTKVNAYADASKLGAITNKVGNVDLDARSDSTINSAVVAASLAIGGGGTTGVGVSIGIAVAQNFIGWQPGQSTETPAEVQAYLKNASVQSDGAITQDAIANQTINSMVLAGSAAVGAGGTAGVGVAGSGVWAENRIGVDVKSYIDGAVPTHV